MKALSKKQLKRLVTLVCLCPDLRAFPTVDQQRSKIIRLGRFRELLLFDSFSNHLRDRILPGIERLAQEIPDFRVLPRDLEAQIAKKASRNRSATASIGGNQILEVAAEFL